MERLSVFSKVLQHKGLIIFLSLVLLSSSYYMILSDDALGQEGILSSSNLSAKSLPNKMDVTINGIDLEVEVALSADEQAKGLSIKDNLKSNEGMLFPYETPRTLSFWMKDMKFPIDILWLDGDKKVAHIEENLQPCTPFLPCQSYSPDVQAQYVLETVAGFSSGNGIVEGTAVEFDLPK